MNGRGPRQHTVHTHSTHMQLSHTHPSFSVVSCFASLCFGFGSVRWSLQPAIGLLNIMWFSFSRWGGRITAVSGARVCVGVCAWGGEGNLLSKFMMILKFDNFANFTKGVKLINVIYMNI